MGLDFLQKYSSGDVTIDTDQYYALAALGGLMTWAESNTDLRVKSLNFSTRNMQGILLLDLITTRNLEVIRGNESDLCLMKVVDYTVTRMGKRLLRMSLCQPLFDEGLIENRLDAVQELNTFNSGIKGLLKKCPDLDMVLRGLNLISQKALVKHAEQSINYILQLKSLLKILTDITSDLKNCCSSLLVTICEILNHEKLNDILEMIDNVINEDVVYQKSSIGLRHQRCFAVKSGYNGLLDVARQTYKETTDDVYDLIKDYSEKHSLPIKSNFEVNMGFYMSIPDENMQDKILPLEFINVVKKRKNLVFTTLKLVISVKLKIRCR
jgi:DNA mismatch repair protein MSH4